MTIFLHLKARVFIYSSGVAQGHLLGRELLFLIDIEGDKSMDICTILQHYIMYSVNGLNKNVRKKSRSENTLKHSNLFLRKNNLYKVSHSRLSNIFRRTVAFVRTELS